MDVVVDNMVVAIVVVHTTGSLNDVKAEQAKRGYLDEGGNHKNLDPHPTPDYYGAKNTITFVGVAMRAFFWRCQHHAR